MNNYKDDFITIANKTSSTFYSNNSFIKKFNETHHYKTSITKNFKNKLKKNPKNNSVFSFHREILKSKLFNNEKYSDINDKSNFFITRFNSLITKDTLENCTITNTISDEYFEKHKLLSKNNFFTIPTYSSKIYNTKKPLDEGINQFIKKTNLIRKAKIINQNKIICSKKYMDNITENKEQIDQKIYNLKYAKKLINKYKYVFNKYLKYLMAEVDNQLAINNNLVKKENDLKLEIRVLKNKVDVIKKKFDQGINYQNLLLKVKYRVKELKDLPINILKNYNLEEYIPLQKRNSLLKKNSNAHMPIKRRSSIMNLIKKANSINRKSGNRKSINNSDRENNSNNLFKFEKKMHISKELVYNSSEDFERDMNNIEYNVLKYFEKLSDLREEKYYLNKEREELKQIKKNKEKKEESKINELNYKLDLIKNKFLINQKKLSDLGVGINKKPIFVTLYNKIFDKLANIILSFPNNLEIEYHCPNMYQIIKNKNPIILFNGIKKNTVIFCLWLIEQVVTKLYERFHSYKKDIKTTMLLNEIKLNLEKEKRIILSRNRLAEEIKKRELIESETFEKMNKTLFLPRRKVKNVNNRKVKKIKQIKSIDKINYELNINDIIYY
jgi:hypothetical protein